MSASVELLPLEVWSRVFFWATYNPSRTSDVLDTPSIPLFDAITHKDTEKLYTQALKTKYALSLVSKCWHQLSKEFLYEDIRIRHGRDVLADLLEVSKDSSGVGLGRFVRRVALPKAQMGDVGHSHHWADKATQRIINCCPNIVELSRYHDLYVKPLSLPSVPQEPSENELDSVFTPQFDPILPSIRRIDWDNGTSPVMHRTVGSAPSSIWTSKTLTTLSLSGENYFWNAGDLQSWGGLTISLPNLHTLRINSIYAFGVPGVSTYILSAPKLRRVILDRAEALYRLVECVLSPSSHPTAGHSVLHVEIGAPYWRCLHSDYISTLVKNCPFLETLHYPIFFARTLRWKRIGAPRPTAYAETLMFPNLQKVGWHGKPNTELWAPENGHLVNPHPESRREVHDRLLSSADSGGSSGKDSGGVTWIHLMRHLEALIGENSRMPNIREITLHGKIWGRIVSDMRFHSALDLAAKKSVAFVHEEKSVKETLADAEFDYRTDTLYGFLQSL